MVFLEVDDFDLFEVSVLFPIAAVTTAMFAFGYGIFLFEVVGSEFGALVSGFDGVPDFAFLL